MSNLNYHTGYLPVSKQEQKAMIRKFWMKRIGLGVLLIILCIFAFQTLNSAPTLYSKSSNSAPTELTPAKPLQTASLDPIVNEEIVVLENQTQVASDITEMDEIEIVNIPTSSPEPLVVSETTEEHLISEITQLATDPTSLSFVGPIMVEPAMDEPSMIEPVVPVVDEEVQTKVKIVKNSQTQQIDEIIKQMSADKAITLASQNTENKNTNDAILKGNLNKNATKDRQAITSLTQVETSSPNELQQQYIKDLDRLYNDAELNSLLKENFSAYSTN